jgi:two-component system chemotaxis response regulator CheY
MNIEEEFEELRKTTILVVDDEPAYCTVVCEILRLFGFAAHEALGARRAVELLKEVNTDLILTDVMMPEIDGLSFLRTVRADPAHRHIPAIAITARCELNNLLAAKEAGADACLVKPFSAVELREKVEQVLDGCAIVHLGQPDSSER